jgi:putative membrane protein
MIDAMFLSFIDVSMGSVGQGLLLFAVFGLAGFVMMIGGYKLFDRFTPGDLHAEIFEKKNVAAAILAGSVIIGLSLILAAAMGS